MQSDRDFHKGVIKGSESDGWECLILPGEKWEEVSDQDAGQADGEMRMRMRRAVMMSLSAIYSVCHVAGVVLGPLHMLTPLILITTLQSRGSYYFHFTG